MNGSRIVARVLTALYALIATPIATALIAAGGASWYRLFRTTMYLEVDLGGLLSSVGIGNIVFSVLGLLILATVLATGLASSAGYLVVGVMGLVGVACAAFPALLFELYGMLNDIVPVVVLDGLYYGLPLGLHPLIGALGIALLLARRGPRAPAIGQILGLVGIPLALAGGSLLLFRGVADGMRYVSLTFDMSFQILPVATVLGGLLLITLAAVAARWSPYALIIPGIIVALLSIVVFLPALAGEFGRAWSSPTFVSVVSYLILGGGAATALVLLETTLVLAGVRAMARRREARKTAIAGIPPIAPPGAPLRPAS